MGEDFGDGGDKILVGDHAQGFAIADDGLRPAAGGHDGENAHQESIGGEPYFPFPRAASMLYLPGPARKSMIAAAR